MHDLDLKWIYDMMCVHRWDDLHVVKGLDYKYLDHIEYMLHL